MPTPIYSIICNFCQHKFDTYNENRKFCSRRCSAILNNTKYPKRIKQPRTKKLTAIEKIELWKFFQ